MEPQPSTSKQGTSKDAAARDDDDGSASTDGVHDDVASTSGSASSSQQQLEEQLSFYLRASVKQCQQLFGATCHVKLQRCDEGTVAPSTGSDVPADSRTLPKVEEESDSTGNSSSSDEDDDVKVFSTIPPSTSSTKKRPVPTPASKNNATAATSSTSEGPFNSRTHRDSTGSSSCSEDDEVKVLPPPQAPVPSVTVATPALGDAQAHSTKVGKVEDESDTGSSSSEEDDVHVKLLPAPPAPRESFSKQKEASAATKRKGGKRVPLDRKSSARCEVCGKTMWSKEYLRLHMRKHTGTKRYSCDICRRSFWCCSQYRNHTKARDQRNGVCPRENKKHDGGWRPKGSWKCKICGKRMKHPGSYMPHMKRHRKKKRFKCEDCGKTFGRNDYLSEHRRIHSGVWQYTCLFCDKGFHWKSEMFCHLRVHTEEKPYFCVVDGCGQSFRALGTLKKHRRLIHLKKY